VATVPSPSDSLTYGVLGARPDGTQFDRVTYARRGNYRPVVAAPSDSTTITYDPDAVPRSDAEPTVTFRDPASPAARYAAFVQDVEARQEAFTDAMQAADRAERRAISDTFDWAPNRTRLASALEKDLPSSTANAYRVAYLAHTFDADSTVAKAVLSTMPASSPLWGVEQGGLFQRAVYTAGGPRAHEDLAYEILRENPSDQVRAATLSMLLRRAAQNDETEKQELLYAWMEAEHADSRYMRFARARYAPDRAIQVGKPAPEFSVAALRDTAKTFTRASFEGRYVLLDFWATWCSPCIDELPTLRKADSTYGGDDFTILSLSFDDRRSTVTDFLKDREMPWQHAFAEGGFDSKVANQFEVVGIPKPILLGPNGRIVATEKDLRGEALLETLNEHLGPTADATGDDERSGAEGSN
jgi:thiol-disulfide isomerase/thioredoxin